MSETMYKFLTWEGKSSFQGTAWHLPKDGNPGEWMPPVKGDLIECENGYHMCRPNQLLEWACDTNIKECALRDLHQVVTK